MAAEEVPVAPIGAAIEGGQPEGDIAIVGVIHMDQWLREIESNAAAARSDSLDGFQGQTKLRR